MKILGCINLKRAIENKRRENLRFGVILFRDMVRPRTAAKIEETIQDFLWKLSDHSVDLAPTSSSCTWNSGAIDEELKMVVVNWFNFKAASFYAEGL